MGEHTAADMAEHGIERVRADNPGPLTLSGTNSYVVGRDPAYVVDPGPALDDHVDALMAAVDARGGLGGIALTHDHADHAQATAALRERVGGRIRVAAARGADVPLEDGDAFGPLVAVPTPGHAPDHLAFLHGGACFTGDAVLGEGSVFIGPHAGAMTGYLAALARLRALDLDLICPGHGPPVGDPAAKLDTYIAHRLDRERRLVAALDDGLTERDALLARVWDDAPRELWPAATLTLVAHLDRLRDDGRLEVEPGWVGAVRDRYGDGPPV